MVYTVTYTLYMCKLYDEMSNVTGDYTSGIGHKNEQKIKNKHINAIAPLVQSCSSLVTASADSLRVA